MLRLGSRGILSLLAVLAACQPASACHLTWEWGNCNGLSARAEVSLITSRKIQIILENTSTAWPTSLPPESASQLLSSVSFQTGGMGLEIISGSAIIGTGGKTLNFNQIGSQLGPGGNVSAEWGFSNQGSLHGLSRNVITTLTANATKFASGNLDGPSNLDGPQGGLVAKPPVLPLGGMGAIEGKVIFTLTLSGDTTLDELSPGPIMFGSAAACCDPVPEPATLATLGIGALAAGGIRLLRRRAA